MTSIEELTERIKNQDAIVKWGSQHAYLYSNFGNGYQTPDINEVTRELYDANRAFFNREGLHNEYFERGVRQ